MSKKKACPPFCNPDTCHKEHHPLIVHLVNIGDNDERSLDKFKSVLKDSRYSVAPEQPIPDPFREYRYPVLHWASVLGKVAVIEYLIRNGYEPTVKSLEKGETALHRVVLCLHHSLQFGRQQTVIKMFKNLTELLAPALFVKDDNGNTPLHACAILFNQVSAKSLAGLYKKALEIMIEKVKDMEDKGFSKSDGLNMGNREMKTVLHILTSGPPEDCLFLIRRLLDNGADPELQDKEGKSAIDMALECQNKQIFKEMKQKNNRKQSYASETESEICGTRVMKTPKSSLTGQNIVTSTTTKDESEQDDEAQVDNWRKRKWGKAHIEVKPTLYVNETGARVGRQSTDTSVADGPTSTTKSSCKHKRVAWKEEQCPEPCGVEERLENGRMSYFLERESVIVVINAVNCTLCNDMRNGRKR